MVCSSFQENKIVYNNNRTTEQNKSVCNSSATFLSSVALLQCLVPTTAVLSSAVT